MPRYIYPKAISANPLASYTPAVKGRYRFSAHSDANRYTFAAGPKTTSLMNNEIEFNTMHSETFSESMDMFARDERERVGVATVNPFGNGSNGSVVISEHSVITGGDLHCYNLTIKQNKTLYTNGYRIFVQNQLTFGSNAQISNLGSIPGYGYPDHMSSRILGGPSFVTQNEATFPKREYIAGNDGSTGRAIIERRPSRQIYSYAVLGGRGSRGSYGGPGDYIVQSGWAGIGDYEMRWNLRSFKNRDIASNFMTIGRNIHAGGPGGPGYGGSGSATRYTYGGGGGAGAAGGGFIFISANRIKFPSIQETNVLFDAHGLSATGGFGSLSPNYYGGRGGYGGAGGGGVVIINFNSFVFPSPSENSHKSLVWISGGAGITPTHMTGPDYAPGGSLFRGNLAPDNPYVPSGENGSFIFRCISTGRYYSGTRVPGGFDESFIDFPPDMSYFS